MAYTICQAIARNEGYNVPNSRAQRNNNPGNINYGAFAKAHGADRIETIPDGFNENPRFAHFPDKATGFEAMKALLSAHYAGLTITQMYNEYAPPSDSNNTVKLIDNLCLWTGLPCSIVIDDYL